jgi:hypothetical protein
MCCWTFVPERWVESSPSSHIWSCCSSIAASRKDLIVDTGTCVSGFSLSEKLVLVSIVLWIPVYEILCTRKLKPEQIEYSGSILNDCVLRESLLCLEYTLMHVLYVRCFVSPYVSCTLMHSSWTRITRAPLLPPRSPLPPRPQLRPSGSYGRRCRRRRPPPLACPSTSRT